MIGEDPDYLQADTYLVLPEIPSEQMEWEDLYERAAQKDKENYYEWDIYDTWCKETVSYYIEEHYFYKDPLDKDYGKWEASEETMDICYPQIVFKDGRDAALINIAIRNCAMDSFIQKAMSLGRLPLIWIQNYSNSSLKQSDG